MYDINHEFYDILERYKTEDKSYDVLVMCLKDVAGRYGGISNIAKAEIANLFEQKTSYVDAVLERLSSIKTEDFTPTITICTGPRCQANNSLKILSETREYCKNKNNEFDIITSGCMHKCKQGPNIKVNGEHFEKASIDKIMKLI